MLTLETYHENENENEAATGKFFIDGDRWPLVSGIDYSHDHDENKQKDKCSWP